MIFASFGIMSLGETEVRTMASFDFKDVSVFFNWEGRPAVIVEPADGSISAWFIRRSAEPGTWEPANGAEIGDSGRPLSKASFQEVFAKRLASE